MAEKSKIREKNYKENLEPYEDGRKLNSFDEKILKILVDAKFDVSDALKKYQKDIDKEHIERTLRLQADINIILHIWKKNDNSI